MIYNMKFIHWAHQLFLIQVEYVEILFALPKHKLYLTIIQQKKKKSYYVDLN